MQYILLFLIFEVVFVTAQLCTESNPILNNMYKANNPDIQKKEWNYQSITSFEQCKQGITSDTKNFDVSQVSLLNPKISLDVGEMIQLVMDNASGPLAQYKTDQIKLTSWGATNIARYQSVYFTIGKAEHNFDFWSKAPDAEIQVYFIQDQIYQQCQNEPLYAVLSIPIYGLTEIQDIRYTINMNVSTNLDQITDFNFKQNILGAYHSDMTSFVSYKAPLNIPPCENTNWFVLTQPQFIKQILLQSLLGLNAVNTLQRTQLDGTYLNFIKGRFIYEGEDDMKDYDDTVEWAATWVASIIPCLFFALIVCVYGQYELSNIGRFKRPDVKQHEGVEQEALHQDDAIENKLA
ncbi:unnamed protein product [Paramecium pentaurelia]|uniref:Transmembrane protein n=1 Tax=Paramecium pentaurelia TaxID=43138 RepID=A0A8S1XHF9_9CILI|nr:unnamed protein product [Paramecium pentaurelia]